MIKAFILYYLNIKPTHGYEIQKYIQVNHMDSWTKIQSGSIYYALNKLEKEGLIELLREEKSGAKVKKIYQITDTGQGELQQCLKEELGKDLYDIGSDKFIIYPILSSVKKEMIVEEVQKHLELLNTKKAYTEKWRKIKISEHSLKLEAICFEMMLSSLNHQIKWHETLLEELDACIQISEQMSSFIKHVDFSNVEDFEGIIQSIPSKNIDQLKQEILSNPETAAEKLEELIKMLNK